MAVPTEPDPTTLDARHSGTAGASLNAAKVERLLRQAVSNVGPLGGTKFVPLRADRRPAPVREITPLVSDPVRPAFVAPENWGKTRDTARGRRLIILRGEPGHGRAAAALRLLLQPSHRPIFDLDRDVDLHQLPQWLDDDVTGDTPLPLRDGFALCEPSGGADLAGWMLHQLTGALARRDARMVVTVGIDRALDDDVVRDYVVTLGRPQPHAVILASHLRWRLGRRPDAGANAADRILADAATREIIRGAVTDDAPVKLVADLAVMIDQEFDGAAVDLDRLAERVAERWAGDFDIWFGALPDVRSRSFAIALAVLNGLPYDDVVRAARLLADRLDGPPQVVTDGTPMLWQPWRDPFADARHKRLRLLCARTRQIMILGDFGYTAIEIVEYIDGGRPETVLEHVWHEYQLHRSLLDWLRDALSGDPSEGVRIWAGTALGRFATYAFDLVHGTALQALAVDADRRRRDVVAYALRLPARDARLLPLVRRLANRLHGNPAAPLGQATSARLHAVALGPLDVDPVLEKLDRLAILDDHRIAWSIADSLADLIVQDEDVNAPLVLHRIADWLGDRRRNRVAQWAFHLLAQSLRTDVETKAYAQWMVWPGLLLLADQRSELRPLLIGIWDRVLNTGTFPDRVEATIDNWASWAESYSEVRTAFARLLTAIAGTSPRTRALVLRHVARWTEPENLFPMRATADAVKHSLRRNDVP